jgi:hypothetical protein
VEVGLGGGERHQLEEGRVAVEDQLETLTHRQLAALAVALDVALPAAAARALEELLDRVEVAEHGLAVDLRGLGGGVEGARQGRHERRLSALAPGGTRAAAAGSAARPARASAWAR